MPLILGCTKTSLLFFYVRIFSISRLGKSIMYILIAITAAWTIGFFFARLFQCGDNFWAFVGTVFDIIEQCVDTSALSLSFAWSDVITDVIIISAPIPLVSTQHDVYTICMLMRSLDLAVETPDWQKAQRQPRIPSGRSVSPNIEQQLCIFY